MKGLNNLHSSESKQKCRADEKNSASTWKPCLKAGILLTRHIHCIFNLYSVLCGVILLLCLVGTIVDIAVSFAKSDSSPLNANNGILPIRDASIATPDTERISLLQSSPEANIKECATVSRHQEEPVLPSEHSIELSIFHWFDSTE